MQKTSLMSSTIILLVLLLFNVNLLFSQKTYTENGGELIFAFSDVEYQGINLDSRMRFTAFLHMGRLRHYNFTDNLGAFSGMGIRNIGFSTDYGNYIEKRRTFSLGIPAAIKLGDFRNHFYMYAGGEYELFFHYKQKRKLEGIKVKYNEWFSSRTERFVPSLFFGMQFPGGVNLKFKYYLKDFLNRDFRGNDFGTLMDYSDFNKTQIYYFALTFNLKSKDIQKLYQPKSTEAILAEFR
jgi:hypothetical protein